LLRRNLRSLLFICVTLFFITHTHLSAAGNGRNAVVYSTSWGTGTCIDKAEALLMVIATTSVFIIAVSSRNMRPDAQKLTIPIDQRNIISSTRDPTPLAEKRATKESSFRDHQVHVVSVKFSSSTACIAECTRWDTFFRLTAGK